MMYEILNVTSNEPGIKRRWFADSYFELIVWHEQDDSIIGFQLCYDRYRNEQALTWMRDKGFRHDKVDGDSDGVHTMATPILNSGGAFPAQYVIDKFKESSENIDKDISNIVIDKLNEYYQLTAEALE